MPNVYKPVSVYLAVVPALRGPPGLVHIHGKIHSEGTKHQVRFRQVVVSNKASLNNHVNNLCMSARSTGGCLGTQGGGCALVILSISSAKKNLQSVDQILQKRLSTVATRKRENE